MDIKLMEIASKPAGTYFIVTDKSQVSADITVSKMRLIFINSERGPVNTIVLFQQGDVTGFNSVFGKSSRQLEKKGNLSINTALKCLEGGPLAVMNLRKFDDGLDILSMKGFAANSKLGENQTGPYTKLFNTNSLWTVMPKNIPDQLKQQHLINIANVGTSDFSIFCVVSTVDHVKELTNEGDSTLKASDLVIDEYPALNFEMLVKDTFIDIYVFNNTFDPLTVGTNKYYGHLFDAKGNLDLSRLVELTNIPEAGFDRRITGSLIPNLKSESDVDISIDKLVNQTYSETGLVCFINDEILESDDKNTLDFDGSTFYDEDGNVKPDASPNLLSHVVPTAISKTNVAYPPFSDKLNPINDQQVIFETEKISETEFVGVFEQGIAVGDRFRGPDGSIVDVIGIEILESDVPARDPDEPKANYTITIPAPTNGSIVATVDGVAIVTGAKVQEGKTVVLTNVPATNYEFSKYVISGVEMPVKVTSFIVSKDSTIEVAFTPIMHLVHHNDVSGAAVSMIEKVGSVAIHNGTLVKQATEIKIIVGNIVTGNELKSVTVNGGSPLEIKTETGTQYVETVVDQPLEIVIAIGAIATRAAKK